MPKLKSKSRIQNENLNYNKNKEKPSILRIKQQEHELEISETESEIFKQKLKLKQAKVELAILSAEVDNARRKLQHKREKLKEIQAQTDSVSTKIQSSQQKYNEKTAFSISKLTASKRKLKPSTDDLPLKAKSVRRQETYNACRAIHGGKENSDGPVLTGMVETLSAKFKKNVVADAVLKKGPLSKSLTSKCVNAWRIEYYSSEDNIKRSLNNFYSKNVMGKRKYESMRLSNSQAVYKGNKIPNVVPYQVLSKAMNEIDIGTLIPFSPSLLKGVPAEDVKDGIYRDCRTYLLRLAEFYLNANYSRVDKLKTFPKLKRKDKSSFLFLIAFGGDGAPGYGMSFLVSFLNVAQRLPCSSENFLIFGGNVKEDSIIVRNYLKILMADLKYLESLVFEITTINDEKVKVEFSVSEIPADMKMLAFLGGELSNSAIYFSTFADVSKYNMSDIDKQFGIGKKADWKPYDYKDRLKNAKLAIAKKKQMLKGAETLTDSQRDTFSSFVSQKLNCRQKETPLIGEYISLGKAEPLHLKNNVVHEIFHKLLIRCLKHNDLGKFKAFKDIPDHFLISKFVDFIKKTMHCNWLANKIIQWFNESFKKGDKDFKCRFRGKESLCYFKFFPEICKLMIGDMKNKEVITQVLEIFHCSLLLRKIVSLSVRIEQFDHVLLQEMKAHCKELFKCCCVFFKSQTPSCWTLTQVVPVHAQQTLEKYGFGLGCNSMEGREQKHQCITKYAENTTFKNRWQQIFRHEYIHLIYLRENNFDKLKYFKTKNKYLPNPSDDKCKNCLSLMDGNVCSLCTHDSYKKILVRISKLEKKNKKS